MKTIAWSLFAACLLTVPGCAVFNPSADINYNKNRSDLKRSTEMLAGQIAASPENLERTFRRAGNTFVDDVAATGDNLSRAAGWISDEFNDDSLQRTVRRVGGSVVDDVHTFPNDLTRFLSLIW